MTRIRAQLHQLKVEKFQLVVQLAPKYIMSTKICGKCRRECPTEAFGPDGRTGTGISKQCTPCRISKNVCGRVRHVTFFPGVRHRDRVAVPLAYPLPQELPLPPLPAALPGLAPVLPSVLVPAFAPPLPVREEPPLPVKEEPPALESLELLFPPSLPAPAPPSLEVLPHWIQWEEAPALPPAPLEEEAPIEILRQKVLTALQTSMDFKLLSAIDLLLQR